MYSAYTYYSEFLLIFWWISAYKRYAYKKSFLSRLPFLRQWMRGRRQKPIGKFRALILKLSKKVWTSEKFLYKNALEKPFEETIYTKFGHL